MRKLASGVTFIGALVLAACGGGQPEQPDTIIINPPQDSGTENDGGGGGDAGQDAGLPIACNPVGVPGDQGCAVGEKCSWLVELDDGVNFLARTACVPDGAAVEGDACMFGEPGPDTGFDNCVAGQVCRAGVCAPVCTIAPDSCDAVVETCQRYNQLFDDDPMSNIGVCDPTCNPLDITTCPTGQSCYVNVFDDSASCAGIAGMVRQGDVCQFLNSCAPFDSDIDGTPDTGSSCSMAFPNDNNLYCATHCNPMDGAADQLCLLAVNSPTARCVPISGYWDPASVVFPPDIGMCVDCGDARISMFDVCAP